MPILGFVAFIAFGIAQFTAAFVGIEHGIGFFWACAALVVCFLFRFTLPITIGAFFGAMNVWGWHWLLAALFAVPGLLFVIPGMLTSALLLFIHGRSKQFRRRTNEDICNL